jgi:environmental stress-induced protein Ves
VGAGPGVTVAVSSVLAMVTPRTIRAGSTRVMPWKNGQGSTTELAVEPPGATLDDFLWRVSIAELRAPGPFSTFPGYDRIITQLDGPPMTLTHAGRRPVVLQPLVPHAFSGDDETDCDVAGIAHDFNLIVRRGHARGALTVHWLGEGEILAGEADAVTVLHLLEGELTASGGELLRAGDTHIEEAGRKPSYSSRGRALVLLASLYRAGT